MTPPESAVAPLTVTVPVPANSPPDWLKEPTDVVPAFS
jgi:hypothetical protein